MKWTKHVNNVIWANLLVILLSQHIHKATVIRFSATAEFLVIYSQYKKLTSKMKLK